MILTTPFEKAFTDELKQAVESWFALALVTDDGYAFLQGLLPLECKQRFIVGINLPTSPGVLKNLQNQKEFQSRVFKAKQTYHPKAYIIKKKDGKLVAFIGSSNATNGGFFNNIEANYKIEDQAHCKELIEWFDKLFEQSIVIKDDFLKRYEEVYLRRKRRSSEDKNDLAKVFAEKLPEENADLSHLNFEGMYFDEIDFFVFSEKYWIDYSDETVKKREVVREKLRALHFNIYPRFAAYAITALHPHNLDRYITSLIEHTHWNKKERKAIWLHYGKSKPERVLYDNTSFLNHIRIQVIIRSNLLGIWLVIGKDNGGIDDRKHFQDKLASEDYQELFFNLVKELGTGYEIEISAIGSLKSEEIKSKKELIDFLKQDDTSDYFIIKRDYPPNDIRLSKTQIEETILNEFAKLYQLYDVMREKRFENEEL